MGKRYDGKREDLRVKKTQRAIRDAAWELIRNDPDNLPTAKAIIAKAEINKSTFYYHYESVQDLFDQMETEFFDRVTLRAVNDIPLLTSAPEIFLTRFADFAYDDPANVFAGHAHIKSDLLQRLLAERANASCPQPDASVLSTLLLGLWGFARSVPKGVFTTSIPTLANFIVYGVSRTGQIAQLPSQ